MTDFRPDLRDADRSARMAPFEKQIAKDLAKLKKLEAKALKTHEDYLINRVFDCAKSFFNDMAKAMDEGTRFVLDVAPVIVFVGVVVAGYCYGLKPLVSSDKGPPSYAVQSCRNYNAAVELQRERQARIERWVGQAVHARAKRERWTDARTIAETRKLLARYDEGDAHYKRCEIDKQGYRVIDADNWVSPPVLGR